MTDGDTRWRRRSAVGSNSRTAANAGGMRRHCIQLARRKLARRRRPCQASSSAVLTDSDVADPERVSDRIVRRFPRDRDVVRMRFAEARRRDAHELRFPCAARRSSRSRRSPCRCGDRRPFGRARRTPARDTGRAPRFPRAPASWATARLPGSSDRRCRPASRRGCPCRAPS